jgi:hypothetical protein
MPDQFELPQPIVTPDFAAKKILSSENRYGKGKI